MANEISFNEVLKNQQYYTIIDIRSEDSYRYGHIFGAKNIPQSALLENPNQLSADKCYVLCCKTGRASEEVCDRLSGLCFNVLSLAGGYMGYLKQYLAESKDQDFSAKAERSLQKTFRKDILTKFLRAVKEYNLIEPHDKIAVCISGGKDSFLMAKCFQELLRFTDIPFEVVFLVMDPGYSPENRELIEANAKLLNIPIHIFETQIFESVFNIEKSPCYICARMRRGYLYSEAQKLGCNKIALGHHYDDVIETILMGMLYGGQFQTMMPKLVSTNFGEMQLIRPLYLVREKDIIRWRDYNGLHFLQCACKFTDHCSGVGCEGAGTGSKRKDVKNLIAKLSKDDPQVEANIFSSAENVNLATVIAYKDKSGTRHHFLDDYKSKKG